MASVLPASLCFSSCLFCPFVFPFVFPFGPSNFFCLFVFRILLLVSHLYPFLQPPQHFRAKQQVEHVTEGSVQVPPLLTAGRRGAPTTFSRKPVPAFGHFHFQQAFCRERLNKHQLQFFLLRAAVIGKTPPQHSSRVTLVWLLFWMQWQDWSRSRSVALESSAPNFL